MDACDCPEYHRTRCPVAKALRNSWCTPGWLAKLIGEVDLDPCGNPRSSILAGIACTLEDYGEGLVGFEPGDFFWGVDQNGYRISGVAEADWVVFINPPYGGGQVIEWVRHYRHTRFIYLLRWDPSTAWFGELIHHCTHVWFPPSRIDFEPPPRIRASSNPYPHALYLRDPSPELIARLSTAGYLFTVDSAIPWLHKRTYGDAANDNRTSGRGSGPEGPEADADRREGGAAGDRGGAGPEWHPTDEEVSATKRRWREAVNWVLATGEPSGAPAAGAGTAGDGGTNQGGAGQSGGGAVNPRVRSKAGRDKAG